MKPEMRPGPGPRYQDLSRFRLPPGFRGAGAVKTQLWWIVQATLFAMSPQVCYGWRRFLLRLFGAHVGQGVILRPSVRVTYPWKVSIGDRAWIGDRAELYSLGKITIGADAVVSQDCYLCTGGHDPQDPGFAIYEKPIVIGDEVWLAAQCFVMPGCRIGRGAFCMVRALVTRDIPQGMVAAGQPARVTGPRLPDLPGDGPEAPVQDG